MGKVTAQDLQSMKHRGERITMITSYDYPTSQLIDETGLDVILVGDSLGMVVLGYRNPIPVTVDDIIHHCRAVKRGAENPLLVADLPFMSYHISAEDAIKNSGRLIKEGGADAVKLEGGREVSSKVRAIVDVGIPVMGHIGLMPQRASVGGKFRAQGMDADSAGTILEDALALEAAGAFAVVLEFVAAEAAAVVMEKLRIPTIGIGSGLSCDGQVLVIHDVLGVFESAPPFARRYADLRGETLRALKTFRDDIRGQTFPGEAHMVHMDPAEYSKFKEAARLMGASEPR